MVAVHGRDLPRLSFERGVSLVERQTVELSAVLAHEWFEAIERIVAFEEVGEQGEAVRGRETAGATFRAFLRRNVVRRAVTAEEEARMAGEDDPLQSREIAWGFGRGETVVMRIDLCTHNAVVVDEQMVSRYRGGNVIITPLYIVDHLLARDVFDNDLEIGMSLVHEVEHLDEQAFTIHREAAMHLGVNEQRQSTHFDFVETRMEGGDEEIADAPGRVRGRAQRVEFHRLDRGSGHADHFGRGALGERDRHERLEVRERVVNEAVPNIMPVVLRVPKRHHRSVRDFAVGIGRQFDIGHDDRASEHASRVRHNEIHQLSTSHMDVEIIRTTNGQ